ncbi:hypothetical protein DXG01_006425 [Tephrocybe rancida]|nr:hypothetical protein DXG01_006425 [Tephrocybe rancida]
MALKYLSTISSYAFAHIDLYTSSTSSQPFGLVYPSDNSLHVYVSNPASIHTPVSPFFVKEELAAAPRVKQTPPRLQCECQGKGQKEPFWQKVLSIGFTTLFVIAPHVGPPADKDGTVADRFIEAMAESFDVYSQWVADILLLLIVENLATFGWTTATYSSIIAFWPFSSSSHTLEKRCSPMKKTAKHVDAPKPEEEPEPAQSSSPPKRMPGSDRWVAGRRLDMPRPVRQVVN